MKISLTLFVVVSLLLGFLPHTLAVNSQDNHFDRSSSPLILHNRDCGRLEECKHLQAFFQAQQLRTFPGHP